MSVLFRWLSFSQSSWSAKPEPSCPQGHARLLRRRLLEQDRSKMSAASYNKPRLPPGGGGGGGYNNGMMTVMNTGGGGGGDYFHHHHHHQRGGGGGGPQQNYHQQYPHPGGGGRGWWSEVGVWSSPATAAVCCGSSTRLCFAPRRRGVERPSRPSPQGHACQNGGKVVSGARVLSPLG